MAADPLVLNVSTAAQTAQLATQLAAMLAPGDVILLQGDVGAGKTHFARAAITSLLPLPEDIPSPTFTLVQTYDGRNAAIWHSDLYRLTSTLEIEELGLTEAFDDAICFVEWPDRLGELTPIDALTLTFRAMTEAEERQVEARWLDAKWDAKLAPWATR